MGGVHAVAEAGHLHALLELDMVQEDNNHLQADIKHCRRILEVLSIFYHDSVMSYMIGL